MALFSTLLTVIVMLVLVPGAFLDPDCDLCLFCIDCQYGELPPNSRIVNFVCKSQQELHQVDPTLPDVELMVVMYVFSARIVRRDTE